MSHRTIIASLAASWLLVGAYSARGADAPAAVAPSPQQQAAIAAIEKLGGSVRPVAHDSPLLDVDFHLGGGAVVDADLAQLKPLDKVIWLDLKETKITSAGLANLKEMKSLQRLHLETTAIDDAGLDHLAGLENLEYLNLYGTNVTDAGIKRLAGLKKLKRLYVWRTKVTDAGVAALKKESPGLLIVGGAELPPLSPAEIAAAALKKPPLKTLAKGQFVRVRLPGKDRYLSLAEVQVQKTGDGAELHKGGVAAGYRARGGVQPG
ncbi:MAG: hypothetical protein K8T25_06245 [Planctomycetia bacterium]|nr:hypothetical protein [Planctomycetia bacterium]